MALSRGLNLQLLSWLKPLLPPDVAWQLFLRDIIKNAGFNQGMSRTAASGNERWLL